MTLFDIAAGLVLLVSALVGWIRGGTREVATVAAFVLAAIGAVFALRYTGPLARAAIHTVWIANIVAILVVFAAAYILLRVIFSAVTRQIRRTEALSGLDRIVGAGFGLVRALVILGLANLTIVAITPADRMPAWIRGAALYPLSDACAHVLKGFAPQGAKLARQVAPTIGRAVTEEDDTNSPQNRPQNRSNDDSPSRRGPTAPGVRVEKTR